MQSSRIYYVNSLSRLSGTGSHFTYLIQIAKETGFDRVCLLQANIPISYYVVQAGYNTMTLVELGVNITITVPVGNYSATSFAATFSSLLNAASTHGWAYAVSFPNSFT